MNVSTYMCLSDQSLVQSIQKYKKKKNIFRLINYQLQLFQIEIHEGFPTKKKHGLHWMLNVHAFFK